MHCVPFAIEFSLLVVCFLGSCEDLLTFLGLNQPQFLSVHFYCTHKTSRSDQSLQNSVEFSETEMNFCVCSYDIPSSKPLPLSLTTTSMSEPIS